MRTILLIFCCCLYAFLFGPSTHSSAQIINTFAGDGTPAYGGDGLPATFAYLNNPYGVCVDTLGNVFIADASNNRIRKVDTFGVITTFAGNGLPGSGGDGSLAISASMYSPWSIAADRSGNVFFTDAGNNRIRKINAAGVISTIAGTGTWGYLGDGGQATDARITSSYGIAVDNTGTVYFSDPANNVIRKIAPSGIVSTIAGNGLSGFSGDGTPATSARLNNPHGVAVDGPGNLYIADCNNNRIRKVNTSGIISSVAGSGTGGFSGDGLPAITADLNGPTGVAIDAAGDLFIADQANSRVRKVSASGIINTIAGSSTAGFFGDGGPATAAYLSSPSSIAIDGHGKIFIADYDNERIRVLDNSPVFAGGDTQSLSVCGANVADVNSLLAIDDGDIGQTQTWSLVLPPLHGSAVAAYSAIYMGGTLTPAGLSYTPFAGYSGMDVFSVRVTDGATSDTTTVNVAVLKTPDSGVITGTNKVCVGFTIALTETIAGGVWSTTNANATVSGGIVNGVATGVDSVLYSVSNACGTATAVHAVAIIPANDCDTTPIHTSAVINVPQVSTLMVYPNPSAGTFTITIPFASGGETQFVVTNLLGIKIREFVTTGDHPLEINLDGPAGVYFLSAINANGTWVGRRS